MTRTIAIGAALLIGMASAARADVTVTSAVTGKAMGRDMNSQTVTYIKGTKMRSENQMSVFILDATTRHMIVLNAEKKEAEIYDLSKVYADIEKAVGTSEPKVSFTPNGQKKTILGRSCDGYTLTVAIPMTMGQDTLSMTMTGPAWIAKGAPGSQDYISFYTAAAKNGLIFGAPQQAKQQGAQLKSTTEMYKAFAAAGGIAYESSMEMKFEGTGMMASMMGRMGGMNTTTTVTAVSTDPIPDDKFTVPAGWKTTNK